MQPVAGNPRFASPHNYTPPHLVTKILTAKADLEGERKQVTVLFADIKSSMELLAERDPEDARKIVDPALDFMIDAVHRYEGTVNSVMGDEIMALFGAPLAHEDHAVRACYAALGMQQAIKRYSEHVQLPLKIRVEVNSGEIVVSAIGNDLRMDYSVIGLTAHLAARMEQMAKPGSVLTTANTMQMAEGYVIVTPLGLLPVKGLVDPVSIYEVKGASSARNRLEAAVGRGLTPFVGRDIELQQLRRAQQLSDAGRGQLAAVIGEPGVGKSRLLQEFLHSNHTAGWLRLEASLPSYGRATPYLPVIELLRSYFKIGSYDSTQSIRDKVTGRISELDKSLRDAIPALLDLLDALDDQESFLSLDLAQHRQQSYQAVIRLILSENRVQPVIVVFEDLHWYDSITLGLLNELIVAAQNARVFILVSYRSEYRDRWTSRPNYRQLALDPLANERLVEFFDALLGSDPKFSLG